MPAALIMDKANFGRTTHSSFQHPAPSSASSDQLPFSHDNNATAVPAVVPMHHDNDHDDSCTTTPAASNIGHNDRKYVNHPVHAAAHAVVGATANELSLGSRSRVTSISPCPAPPTTSTSYSTQSPHQQHAKQQATTTITPTAAWKVLNSSTAAVQDVLYVMHQFPQFVDLQRLACYKLWIHSYDDETATYIGARDGTSLVLRAMATWSHDVPLLHYACETLNNLCATHDSFGAELCRRGGVAMLLQAMLTVTAPATTTRASNHSDNDKSRNQFLVCACQLVASLATGKAPAGHCYRDYILYDMKGLEVFMYLVQLYQHGNAQIVEAAREALSELGYDFES